ncbi:MAG TPA: nucleotide disphospho-sugar-binding domain-containing protein [Nevskia sp.]|nr:nucleotide disphospho-sugar-binding domain-containing protein [Nevskia sp.]
MSRILLGWELGGGYGHLASLRTAARALRAAGHDCMFAVRMLENAAEFLEPELGPVLQAPVRLGNGRNPVALQLSYASLLHNVGFDDPPGLAARIAAWRGLLRACRAERLVVDHSPIALIAARSLDIPAAAIGTGFDLPPLTSPFPSFQPWAPVPAQQLQHNEQQVLSELNRALERLRLPPYASLQQIYQGCARALLTYPELDHYDAPRQEPCLGVPDYAQGAAPEWPAGEAPRVLAYLRPHPQLDAMLKALSASKARVLLRIAEITPEQLRPYLRPGFHIVGHPVHLRRAAEECDAYLHYAAHGTVAELLLAGKPGVLWPDNVERWLVARRAEQLGAAVVAPQQKEFDVAAALERALDDGGLRRAAEAFAARHRGHDRAAIAAALAQRVLAA